MSWLCMYCNNLWSDSKNDSGYVCNCVMSTYRRKEQRERELYMMQPWYKRLWYWLTL